MRISVDQCTFLCSFDTRTDTQKVEKKKEKKLCIFMRLTYTFTHIAAEQYKHVGVYKIVCVPILDSYLCEHILS